MATTMTETTVCIPGDDPRLKQAVREVLDDQHQDVDLSGVEVVTCWTGSMNGLEVEIRLDEAALNALTD